MYRFISRSSAGRQLAVALDHHADSRAQVLGIVRGGVIVASHVVGPLQADLDVVIAHETSIATYVEDALPALDPDRVITLGLHAEDVDNEISVMRSHIVHEQALFRGHRPFPYVGGRPTIVIDDGTSSARLIAAVLAMLRERAANPLVFAVPLVDPTTLGGLRAICDELVVLQPIDAHALGRAYRDSVSITEVDVIVQLARARHAQITFRTHSQPHASP